MVQNWELFQSSAGKEGFDFETAVGQTLLFLLAGFETTANLFMWVSYYLALYPHIQQEVYEQISQSDGSHPNYKNVNQMVKLGEEFLIVCFFGEEKFLTTLVSQPCEIF